MTTRPALRLSPIVVAIIATIGAASCGGDEPEAADTTIAGTTTTLVLAAETSAPVSIPPETTPPTEATTTEPTVPPTEPEDADALCLEGEWLLDAGSTEALYATLLPNFPLTVVGTQTLAFDGEAAEQYINVLLQFNVPGMSVELPYDVHDSGAYTVSGGVVGMNWTTVEGGVDDAFAQWLDTSGNDAGTYDMLVPLLADAELPRYAGGPITCDQTTLTLAYTSGLADAAAVYTRM